MDQGISYIEIISLKKKQFHSPDKSLVVEFTFKLAQIKSLTSTGFLFSDWSTCHLYLERFLLKTGFRAVNMAWVVERNMA